MSTSQRFSVNEPKVVFESFDDELVLVNLDTGSYYTFDKAGAYVWSLVEKGLTTAEAVERACRRYAGDAQAIGSAVTGFIEELKREDLIRENHGRAAAAVGEEPGDRLPFEAPKLQKYTDMEELLLLDPIHEVDDTGWPNLPPSKKS